MKKWTRMVLDRSGKITKTKTLPNFIKSLSDCNSNEHYINKETLLNFYMKRPQRGDKFSAFDIYLKKNLNREEKTLSIGSGRGIVELSLLSNNFNITCSDIFIPPCYESSKKLFGNFDYIKFDILKETAGANYDNIFCFGLYGALTDLELEKFFLNSNKMLKKDGILILEPMLSADNLTCLIFYEIYLFFETYLIYYLSKLFNSNYGIRIDTNTNIYRRKNKEIIKLANEFGFDLLALEENDYFLISA